MVCGPVTYSCSASTLPPAQSGPGWGVAPLRRLTRRRSYATRASVCPLGHRDGALPSVAPVWPSRAILAPPLGLLAAARSARGLQTASGRSHVPVPSTRRAHGVGPATRRRLAFPISALDRRARPTGSHICVASKKIVETSLEVSRPVPV
jgi:hypothetical protein